MKAHDGHSGRVNLASADNSSDVISALLKAAVLLRVQFAEFLERYEMTEGRYAVLTALARAGSIGLSQAAVAEQLMHSESNVSSLIDRLQHDGLVDRNWSAKDRRKRVLSLTAAGQVLVDQVEAERRTWAAEILSGMTADNRSDLLSLLKKFPLPSDVDSVHQMSRLSVNRVREPPHQETEWQRSTLTSGIEASSPQSALERMLSTLGMAGRFAEGER